MPVERRLRDAGVLDDLVDADVSDSAAREEVVRNVERITASPEGYSIVRVPWRGLRAAGTDDRLLPDAPTLTAPSALPAA